MKNIALPAPILQMMFPMLMFPMAHAFVGPSPSPSLPQHSQQHSQISKETAGLAVSTLVTMESETASSSDPSLFFDFLFSRPQNQSKRTTSLTKKKYNESVNAKSNHKHWNMFFVEEIIQSDDSVVEGFVNHEAAGMTSMMASVDRMWDTLRPHCDGNHHYLKTSLSFEDEPLSLRKLKRDQKTKTASIETIQSSVDRMMKRLEPYTTTTTTTTTTTDDNDLVCATTSPSTTDAILPFFCSQVPTPSTEASPTNDKHSTDPTHTSSSSVTKIMPTRSISQGTRISFQNDRETPSLATQHISALDTGTGRLSHPLSSFLASLSAPLHSSSSSSSSSPSSFSLSKPSPTFAISQEARTYNIQEAEYQQQLNVLQSSEDGRQSDQNRKRQMQQGHHQTQKQMQSQEKMHQHQQQQQPQPLSPSLIIGMLSMGVMGVMKFVENSGVNNDSIQMNTMEQVVIDTANAVIRGAVDSMGEITEKVARGSFFTTGEESVRHGIQSIASLLAAGLFFVEKEAIFADIFGSNDVVERKKLMRGDHSQVAEKKTNEEVKGMGGIGATLSSMPFFMEMVERS